MKWEVDLNSQSARPPATVGDRVCGTVVFLVAFAFGVGLFALIMPAANRSWQARHWPSAPCTIESSSIVENNGAYRFNVSYRYDFNGKSWRSTQVQQYQDASSPSYSDVHPLADAYPAGAVTRCFVDPADPSRAILRQSSLWVFPLYLSPLLFAAFGAGGIYMTWRDPRLDGLRALTNRAAARGKAPIWVCILLIAVGAAGFYGLSGRTILDVESARHWPATPCVVRASRIQTESGDDGSTYSIDILYAYTVGGREHLSNRYDFQGGSSSSYDGKAAIVQAMPPGTRSVCYVRPGDPDDAVLYRGYSVGILFGLIPLVIGGLGVIGLVVNFRIPKT